MATMLSTMRPSGPKAARGRRAASALSPGAVPATGLEGAPATQQVVPSVSVSTAVAGISSS
eukprot:8914271-Alexandrium_andersonii.AAC.1